MGLGHVGHCMAELAWSWRKKLLLVNFPGQILHHLTASLQVRCTAESLIVVLVEDPVPQRHLQQSLSRPSMATHELLRMHRF